jgi:predicted histone-like DNA-binding protein
MRYKLEQRSNPRDLEAQKKWYAVPVTGETVSNESLSKEIAERSSFTEGDVDNTLDNLGVVLPEHWKNGSPVKLRNIGTFRVSFHSEGTDNPNDFVRKNISNVHIVFTPDAQMLKSLGEMHLEDSGERGGETLAIDWLTDTVSGEANSRLTPGGGVKITGQKMKIVGSDPSVGIYLIEKTTNTATAIPATSILVNKAGEIVFVLPATLPTGNYKLSITTQFSGATDLKAPRTCVFEHTLTVE